MFEPNPSFRSAPLTALLHRPWAAVPDRRAIDVELDDDASPVEWSEEDIVFLHWRLLQERSACRKVKLIPAIR